MRTAQAEVQQLASECDDAIESNVFLLFSFSELCTIQAILIPTQPYPSTHRTLFACYTADTRAGGFAYLAGLLNLIMVCAYLALAWALAQIAPIPKAGKDPTTAEGHRPISLLAPLLKILDKLLHGRIVHILLLTSRTGNSVTCGVLTRQHGSSYNCCILQANAMVESGLLSSTSKAHSRDLPPAFVIRALWKASVQ